jgi:hypothetical protein
MSLTIFTIGEICAHGENYREAGRGPKWFPTHWADTGCEHSPSCFTCPLPRCKYDRRSAIEERNEHILAAYQGGVSVLALCEQYRLSERVVRRAVRGGAKS